MKKLLVFLIVLILLSFSLSCNETKILDINDVIWENSEFKVLATSNQLKKQNYSECDKNDNDYYSSIVLDDTDYFCLLGIGNKHFTIVLFDNDGNVLSYYGNSDIFLTGYYDDCFESNGKDYKYYFDVLLINEGQYYDYCLDNEIEFPKMITFYGYEK